MMASPNKPSAKSVFLRPMRRIWTTPTGHIVSAPQPTTPPDTHTVNWTAHVVDTSTDTAIDDYPTITGDTTAAKGADTDREITLAYIEKCRFADGAKPDITKLESNLNAGIWEVDIQVNPPATA